MRAHTVTTWLRSWMSPASAGGLQLLVARPGLRTGEDLRGRPVMLRDDAGVISRAHGLVQERIKEPDGLLALRRPGGVDQGDERGGLRCRRRRATEDRPAARGIAPVEGRRDGDTDIDTAVHGRV